MLSITLPTEKAVRAAVNGRIAQLSFQMDVARLSQEVMRSWIGKKVNKRLAEQMHAAAKSAADARRTSIFPTIKKRDWPMHELNYDLTWYQSGPSDSSVKLEMPTAVFPGPLTEEAVDNLYQYGVHTSAMLRNHTALIAYRDHPTWIADAVRTYTEAVAALTAAADAAGPHDTTCNSDGSPSRGIRDSLIYPINQLFAEPFITHRRED